jgi:hypothetical protein
VKNPQNTALTGYLNLTPDPVTGANQLVGASSVPGATSPFGNVHRNSVRGFAYYSTNSGVHKAFPLWNEHTTFDFRFEAFNLLNHPNYRQPNSDVSDGTTFGQIVAAGSPRQMQLAAKIIF